LKAFIITVSRLTQKVEAAIISCSILGIAALTIANVIARTVFNNSLSFAEEISQFLIIAVTFLGLSYAVRMHRHIRMTAISDQINSSLRQKLMIGIMLGTAVLMFLLCGYSMRYVLAVYQLGGIYPVTRVPYYVVYLLAPLGFALAGIHYSQFFWHAWNGKLKLPTASVEASSEIRI